MVSILRSQDMSKRHHLRCSVPAEVFLPLIPIKLTPHFTFVFCWKVNVVVFIYDDTAIISIRICGLESPGLPVGHGSPSALLYTQREDFLPSESQGLVFALEDRVTKQILQKGFQAKSL